MKEPYHKIDGPIYPDDCGHGGYVCSFRAFGTSVGKLYEDFDLYVFQLKNDKRQHVCIRYGYDGDYYSPGSIDYLIKNSQFEPCYTAYLALAHHGIFKWEQNDTAQST